MKLKELIQASGLLLALCGCLWLVLMPNYTYQTTTSENAGSIFTTSVRNLDMPYAFALLAFGVLLVIVGLFTPEGVVISSGERKN